MSAQPRLPGMPAERDPARCVICGGKTWRRLSQEEGVHVACEAPKREIEAVKL